MSLRRLFEELVELPPEQQREKLAAATLSAEQKRQVQAMLQSAEADAPLDRPLEAWFDRLGAGLPAGEFAPGTRVGPFEVMDRLGSGGTAVVYRARRPAGDGFQQVALKLLRTAALTPDEERRLRREQAILAQLSHPNIARLIEGGLDAGRPFIAMELVDGHPITEFADERALGLRERLQLFATLCRAIQSAHAALVVHCDLKPSNVLVDADGVLKVLDFGIARLVDAAQGAETTRSVALTPEYAAPEQFRVGPPSTLVDVYALGVMLGELLTGLRLLNGVSASAAVRDSTLPTPRGLPERERLAPKLRGDLDCILRRATAPDPGERYASAQALAEDIDRYLAHRPVRARAGSPLYRAWRFLARHPLGTAATLLAVASLIALSAVALQRAREAREASVAAEVQAQRADAMRDIAWGVFEEAEPGNPRAADATVSEAVEQAIARLETDADIDRRVRLEVLARLADVVDRRGNAQRGLELHRALVREAEATLAPDDELRLHLELRLVDGQNRQGDYAAARPRIDALLEATRNARTELRFEAFRRSALLASHEKRRDLALAHAAEATALARTLGPDTEEGALVSSAAVASNLELWPQAKAAYAKLLELSRARFGERHEDVARAWSGLARAERGLGNYPAAEHAIRAALDIDAQVYAGPHYNTANHYNALVRLLQQQRRLDEALDAARRSLDIARASLAPDDRRLTYHLQDVGWILALLERYDEAEPFLREAWDARRALGGSAFDIAVVQVSVGFVQAQRGQIESGASLIDEALAELAARPEYAEQYAIALEKRYQIARLAGQFEYALAIGHRAEEPFAALSDSVRPRYEGRARALRGIALADLQRNAAALPELQGALAAFDAAAVKGEPVLRADALAALARMHESQGDEKAAQAARAALEASRATLGYVPQRLRR